MASNKSKSPEVTLSRFKFTNWQGHAEDVQNDKKPDRGAQPKRQQTMQQPVPTGNTPAAIPLPYEFRRPEAYERMAADKPGEELAPDATIWKLYLEEAHEHDEELVKSRQESLDMLLLFAALFSAILTAFLIESKELLQQDPADVSVALLLLIAQSQQRIELGLPVPENTAPIDIPSFSPPMSARWVNGIWFSSLALSLSAALVAMLSKEWLTAYLSSRPRPAYPHAMLRQSRLEGLEDWWALHIIALLPSLLHLSLLLFSIGLVIYLRTLDAGVAAVIAGVIGITVLFYISTAILGAIHEFCPYVTQISGYIKAASAAYRNGHTPSEEGPTPHTSRKDLSALFWLANHARDPAVVDCSYHALAGLRVPTSVSHSTASDSGQAEPSAPSGDILSGLLIESNQKLTLGSLFSTVCERFSRLTRNRDELPVSSWANIARYSKVILGLARHIQQQDSNAPSNRDDAGRKEALCLMAPLDTSSVIETLNACDNLWDDNAPPLHADVYASFVANELTLLNLVVSSNVHIFNKSSTQASPPTPTTPRFGTRRGTHVIDVAPSAPGPTQDRRLPCLQAQYSRTLVRANALIWLHAHRNVKIGTVPLQNLLDALRIVATCDALNPTTGHSTHHPQNLSDNPTMNQSTQHSKLPSDNRTTTHSIIHPQSPSDDTSDFHFVTPYSITSSFYFEAEDLSTGLLGALISLISMRPNGQEESLLQTRLAALQVFSTLAPVLLKQSLDLEASIDTLREDFDCVTWPKGFIKPDMNTARYAGTKQMLLLLRYLGIQSPVSVSQAALCHSGLGLIDSYMTENLKQEEGAIQAIAEYGECLIPLIVATSREDSAMAFSLHSPGTFDIMFRLIDISRFPFKAGYNLCNTRFPPNCIPPLIRMVQYARNPPSAIDGLLQSVVTRMKANKSSPRTSADIQRSNIPCTEYLRSFTHSADGFFALSRAKRNRGHREWVVEATTQIVHLATGRDPGLVVNPIELRPCAVPGFLDLVVMVAKYCRDKPEYDEILLEFSRDVADLLTIASRDEGSRIRISSHQACNRLSISLEDIGDSGTTRELLARITEIKRKQSSLIQAGDLAVQTSITPGVIDASTAQQVKADAQPHTSTSPWKTLSRVRSHSVMLECDEPVEDPHLVSILLFSPRYNVPSEPLDNTVATSVERGFRGGFRVFSRVEATSSLR